MDRNAKKRAGLIGSVILLFQSAGLPTAATGPTSNVVEQAVELDVQPVDAIAASTTSLAVTVSNGSVSIDPGNGTLAYETNEQNGVLTAQLGNAPPNGLQIYIAVGDNPPQLLSDSSPTTLASGIGPGTGRLTLTYSADAGLLTLPGTYDLTLVFSLTTG